MRSSLACASSSKRTVLSLHFHQRLNVDDKFVVEEFVESGHGAKFDLDAGTKLRDIRGAAEKLDANLRGGFHVHVARSVGDGLNAVNCAGQNHVHEVVFALGGLGV